MNKSEIEKNVFFERVQGKYRRVAGSYLYRRMVNLNNTVPLISFTFDDAPQTAITNGGTILDMFDIKATYYLSLSMLGSDSPSGTIASISDINHALEKGHEIGCHTYYHNHSWETRTKDFVTSVLKNRQTLSMLFPEIIFNSLAYPICGPKPLTKYKVGKLFKCCRGGGQTFNSREADLNLLKAYFIDIRNNEKINKIKQIIDSNIEKCGWMIFATHDIAKSPSRYGCSIKYFNDVVTYAVESGAHILPVGSACEYLEEKANKGKGNE